MWVYWITLGCLSIILYFPCKRFFSKRLALRASVATFILGMSYPLLLAQLSFWQTLVCLGLLLLFLGVTISRNHPSWDAIETTETKQSPTKTPADTMDIDVSMDYESAQKDQTPNAPSGEQALPEQHSENRDILVDTKDNTDQRESEYSQPIEESLINEEEKISTNVLEVNGTDLPEHQAPPLVELAATTVDELSKGIKQDGTNDELAEPFFQVDELEATASRVMAEKFSEAKEFIAEELPQTDTNRDMVRITIEQSDENFSIETDILQESLDDQALDAEQAPLELPEACAVVSDSEQLADVSEKSLEPSQTPDKVEVTPQHLLSEGLRLSKHKQYAQAVRYFNQIIACEPEPEILYLAVSELSSLYQHLGLYPMASDIIKAFIEHPNLKNHPGLEHLIQKMKFIECITVLLKRDHYGQIPYEEVPEAVRREAFDNSLNIKRLFS